MEKHYETVFILNPVLSDKQIKETVKKVENFILGKEGSIINKENWGLKKLAYSIQRKKSGFYSLLEFKLKGDFIKDLDLIFKRDETVMRHLIILMDKHAIKFANDNRSRRNFITTPASNKEEETAKQES